MNLDFWNKVPFLRLVIPLIAGIVFEIHALISFDLAFVVFSTVLVLFICTLAFPRKPIWLAVRSYMSPLIFVLIVSSGFILSYTNRSINYPTHFTQVVGNGEHVFTGKIIIPPQEKARSVKAYVAVENCIDSSIVQGSQGNLLVYFEKEVRALNLEYGDVIVFRASPQIVKPPSNPLQFNFKEHLANSNIYHQVYLPNQSWKRIEERKNSIRSIAFQIRKHLLGVLKHHIKGEQERAVAAALILGYKDDLDPDVVRSFSAAGAMHVLAVSGLHVGIIFLFLNTVFKFLDSSGRYGAVLRVLILLFGLWTYAFVTGLSPSVQRAATMFSFIVVGSATKRPTNIYNTLSASAFILILFDPLIITKVGFQLSYLAVIGIVYLQPKLYEMLYFKNYVLDKVWAITCVSFAAQAATFPLGLYYFHQFPNYFFVSNLIVIPMATIILYGGILLFVFDWAGIAKPIAWLLNQCLTFLNKSVAWVENIPYSLMYGNHIGLIELLLLYSALLFGFLWLAIKKKTWFWLFAGNVLLLLVISTFGRYQNSKQNHFIVYNVPGKSVINLVSGKNNFLISDEDFLNDDSQQLYFLKHNWFAKGHVNSINITEHENFRHPLLMKYNGLIRFNSLRVFHLSDLSTLDSITDPLTVNYLILSGDNFFDLDKIESKIHFEKLILDTSIPRRTASIVQRLAQKRGSPVHNVHTSNAYIRSI